MHVDDYILIDQYLQGDLPDTQKKSFLRRLAEDEDFALAFRDREELNRFLSAKAQRPALQSKMQELGKEYFKNQDEPPGEIRPLWRRPMVMALSLAAAIALVLLVWNPLQDHDLYSQYAEHPGLALVQRSDADATNVQNAQSAYNAGNFDVAYTELKKLSIDNPLNTQAQLALGISALETGRTTEALSIFKTLSDGSSSFQEYGRWYQALTHLKLDDEAKARRILEGFEPKDLALQKKVADFLNRN